MPKRSIRACAPIAFYPKFAFPLFPAGFACLVIALLEIFAVVYETGVIALLNRGIVTLKWSFALSVATNAVSLVLGGGILLILAFLGIVAQSAEVDLSAKLR
ncbi:MAG: hypothetical protein IT330_19600 [Anaerolineae bacterium]|nr:hypothetical protein [Anaerolineae bacterium]